MWGAAAVAAQPEPALRPIPCHRAPRALRSLLLLLACAGCVVVPGAAPPSDAAVPPGTFGEGDTDLAAITLAAGAFSDGAQTYAQPAAAARAAAALDYLNGAVAIHPRWQCVSPDTRALLPGADAALRSALDVPPAATSQSVVDGLLRAADALANDDAPAARRALAPPAFPDAARTLEVLNRLPYSNVADVATQRLQAEVTGMVAGSTCFNGG